MLEIVDVDPLTEELKDCNGGRILDVACSQGDFLKLLAESFEDFTEAVGIDSASDRIEQAKKKYPEGFSFKVMNAEQLDFPDGYFDTVAIRHSLHHLDNVDSVLNEMERVLKPGGRFVVCEVVQSPETEKENSYRHVHHWWAKLSRARGETHNETLTVDEVLDVISRIGLKERKHFEFLEEPSKEERKKEVEDILEVNARFIDELTRRGDKSGLAEEGRQLSAVVKSNGIEYESVVYVFGRK